MRAYLQNVENDSNTPIVYFFTVTLALKDFRGYIPRGTAGGGGQLALEDSGETKIGDLDNSNVLLGTIEEIFWLEM